jgi:transposase InsO family protein
MVRVSITRKNAVWTQDGMHAGRCKGQGVEAQVIKDRASMRLVSAKAGKPAESQNIEDQLEDAKAATGCLPLVWMTDNGPCYKSQELARYLQTNLVIHLKSLPHTPENNGGAEIGIRELKAVSDLGKGRRLESEEVARDRLLAAVNRLNEHRLRASLGYRTSNTADAELGCASESIDRRVFYETCVQRMREARESEVTERRKRRAEREAVFRTLEGYGLIERRRNGRLLEGEKSEGNL